MFSCSFTFSLWTPCFRLLQHFYFKFQLLQHLYFKYTSFNKLCFFWSKKFGRVLYPVRLSGLTSFKIYSEWHEQNTWHSFQHRLSEILESFVKCGAGSVGRIRWVALGLIARGSSNASILTDRKAIFGSIKLFCSTCSLGWSFAKFGKYGGP